jgi:hypothetical protein
MDTLITFRFGIRHDSGVEDFLARTDDSAVIRTAREQLTRPVGERHLFITGLIRRAPDGANLPGVGSTSIQRGASPGRERNSAMPRPARLSRTSRSGTGAGFARGTLM